MPRAVAACRNFFWGFIKFQCMLLEKKSYLIDFSFKFSAINFGNLLMNSFTWEKMFTYCYNKFRPLNHMHYVKCSVNSLLLTEFWLLQKVCGTLDHYFTTTHTIINSKWFTNSLLCDNPRNKASCTGLRHTSRPCRPWSFSGCEMNIDGSGVALISLASVGYDGSRAAQHLLKPHLVFQPNWGWGDLGFFQLLQSNSSPEEV